MNVHEVARRGDKSTFLKILESETPDTINVKDEKGCTPLWIACREGHTAFVRSILSHAKFDRTMVNTVCESKHTPLQIAVCFARDEIVKLLLAQPGIKLNTTDKNGHTPLTLAVKKGFESTVSLLLDMEGIDLGPDGGRKTPLATAFECGHLTIASHLVNAERRQNPTKTYQTLLSWASENDKRDVVRRINDLYTIDPNLQDGDGDTPLSKAAERGNLSMVRLLLENSYIDVNAKNKDGSTPMSRAAVKQHKNVVQLLAAKDNVTLHSLVRAGNVKLTDYLLSCDINVNCKEKYGLTALHMAVIFRQLDIAKRLLSRGVDIDAKDGAGRTPLILAVRHTLRHFVELLLSRSACIKGIQMIDWEKIYNCYSPRMLRISEKLTGGFQVQLADTTGIPQNEPETARSLLYVTAADALEPKLTFTSRVSDFTVWSSFLSGHRLEHSLMSPSRSFRLTEVPTALDELIAVSLTVWIPNIGMFTEGSGWRECGIAWTMGDVVESGGFNQKTKDHYSMLPHGWIPENQTEFFQQLISHLTERWSILCNNAEDLLSERRLNQLQEKGRSEIINDLARDAKSVAELRHCLRAQVRDAKFFVDHYYRSLSVEVDQISLETVEAFARIDDLLQDLDQTIKDLLQLEFAWVSINEAHKSTCLGTSMKRLSWITFIFLPAMFTSSLFGMNVNVLENNPDWRWYLLLLGTLLLVTIAVWLLFKYVKVEEKVRMYSNQWKTEASKRKGKPRDRAIETTPV